MRSFHSGSRADRDINSFFHTPPPSRAEPHRVAGLGSARGLFFKRPRARALDNGRGLRRLGFHSGPRGRSDGTTESVRSFLAYIVFFLPLPPHPSPSCSSSFFSRKKGGGGEGGRVFFLRAIDFREIRGGKVSGAKFVRSFVRGGIEGRVTNA